MQTLLLSYVPAGQLSRQASLRGLSFFLLEHASQTFSLSQLAQLFMVHVTPAVPAVLGFVPLLQAEQLSAPEFLEHVLQSATPSVLSPHGTHFFPFSASFLGKNPNMHSNTVTHEVESPAVLRYLPALHVVHVTLVVSYVQAAHPVTPAAAGVRPVFLPLHNWQIFFCVLLSMCSKYPSGHHETQEVDPVGVCRKPVAHSVHVAIVAEPLNVHVLHPSTPL